MKKRIICFASVLLAVLYVIGLASAAADTAGNVLISDNAPAEQTVERDLYWAGSSRTFNGYNIGKSLLAAGWDIMVSETEIGGSLRAGAYSIALNSVNVTDNISAAAFDLKLSDVTASGAYLTGNSVNFNGRANYVLVAAGKVTLDGEIKGNADIYANSVILGENLQVDGTLTVYSDKKPALPSGAKIGMLNFIPSTTGAKTEAITVTPTVQSVTEIEAAPVQTESTDEQPPVQIEITTNSAPAGKSKSSGIKDIVFGILGTLLLGTVIWLLLGGKELRRSGTMLLKRPIPVLGTGFASLFVVPGILLVLLFTGFGGSSAGLLAMLFAIVCFYSLTYTGVTLANTLLPRLIKNRILNHSWVCSLIGALVFWLLRKIPVFGIILTVASLIYTMGYFLQRIYLRMKSEKSKQEEAAE